MSLTEADFRQGKINDQLSAQLEGVGAQIEAKVEHGRNRLAEWRADFSGQASRTFQSMDRYAHENPWPLVCTATILGMVCGAICGRR